MPYGKHSGHSSNQKNCKSLDNRAFWINVPFPGCYVLYAQTCFTLGLARPVSGDSGPQGREAFWHHQHLSFVLLSVPISSSCGIYWSLCLFGACQGQCFPVKRLKKALLEIPVRPWCVSKIHAHVFIIIAYEILALLRYILNVLRILLRIRVVFLVHTERWLHLTSPHHFWDESVPLKQLCDHGMVIVSSSEGLVRSTERLLPARLCVVLDRAWRSKCPGPVTVGKIWQLFSFFLKIVIKTVISVTLL